jgi:hypothetical protein
MTQPLFEAYRLLCSSAPRTDRLTQVLDLLRLEIEKDGAFIYEDPQTGELRCLEPLSTRALRTDAQRATRGAVVEFRKR